MAHPSSSYGEAHEVALQTYHRQSGNALHLHGEGGEVHSRRETGAWLRAHRLRQSYFVCTQICHDDWDETNKQPINSFTPRAVHDDITTDLDLIGTDFLDMVYLDDRPELAFEPVIEAIGREIASGRLRSFSVRNFTSERLRAAQMFALDTIGQGIAAVVTTELSLFVANYPLWSEYVPFDKKLRQEVAELGLGVLAHVGDFTAGQCAFGDEDPVARMRPEWIERWQHPANIDIATAIQEVAAERGCTTREIQVAWLLNQPFPVVAIVSLPTFQTEIGAQYKRGSQISLTDEELVRLRNH